MTRPTRCIQPGLVTGPFMVMGGFVRRSVSIDLTLDSLGARVGLMRVSSDLVTVCRYGLQVYGRVTMLVILK